MVGGLVGGWEGWVDRHGHPYMSIPMHTKNKTPTHVLERVQREEEREVGEVEVSVGDEGGRLCQHQLWV